jgi:hypothetical protein
MIFAEGTEVTYKGSYGVINFVCETYVVVKFPPSPGRNSPLVLVFRNNYKQLEILKASTK